MVSSFTAEQAAAKERLAPIDCELQQLKSNRTHEARCRKAQLHDRQYEILSRAETLEYEAYGRFKTKQADFAPRVLKMLRRHSPITVEEE
ncbi:MAG: hypothetical protein JWM32_3114 [Verrucomicrobia bacterium]|nr:hypothetical protein [Verrucomicrobiota bacterium]